MISRPLGLYETTRPMARRPADIHAGRKRWEAIQLVFDAVGAWVNQSSRTWTPGATLPCSHR
jgi:hypothetical protein